MRDWLESIGCLAVIGLLFVFAPWVLELGGALLFSVVLFFLIAVGIYEILERRKSRRVAQIHREIAAASGDPLCSVCGHLLKLHEEHGDNVSVCTIESCHCRNYL